MASYSTIGKKTGSYLASREQKDNLMLLVWTGGGYQSAMSGDTLSTAIILSKIKDSNEFHNILIFLLNLCIFFMAS